jgi:hypothetical protein
VIVTGCGGPSSTPSAGDATQPSASPTNSLPAAATAQSGGSTPGSSAAASSQASAAAAASGAASAAATSRGSKVTTKPPGKPSGFTRAGSYTYTVSGTAKQPIGGDQNISGTETYAVDPPSGSNQHSKTSGKQGSQDMTVSVRNTGLFLVDIHITQQGFDEDFRPSGTALYFPASYHTGSHWSWQAKSTDGKYTISVTSKVSGNSTVAVAGKAEKALVLDSTLKITGAGFNITGSQRDWVSTTYALILKEHNVTHGTAYGASFSSDVARQLKSTTPS